MIDWKILAGGVVALLFVSTLFLGGSDGLVGIGNFLSGIGEALSGWLGGSPFGGLSSSPKASTQVSFVIHSSNFTLSPSKPFTASFGNAEAELSGSVSTGNPVVLKSKDATIKVPGPVEISGLTIASLKLTSAKFDILPNATTDSGSLEVSGFSGSALVTESNITFEGNVTKLVANIGGLNWQLV